MIDQTLLHGSPVTHQIAKRPQVFLGAIKLGRSVGMGPAQRREHRLKAS